MKLADILILSLAVVFVIIGIYEIMVLGPASGYWAVALALAFLFWYQIRKTKTR